MLFKDLKKHLIKMETQWFKGDELTSEQEDLVLARDNE